MRYRYLSSKMLTFLIALCMCIAGSFGTLSKANASNHGTIVFIAEDATKTAQCLRSVDNGSAQPCPPGSIIYIRETTLENARRLGIANYAIKSSDEKQNRANKDRLATSLNAQLKSAQPVSLLACTAGTRNINQSYLYIPSDTASTRIGFNLTYSRSSACAVTSIQDRNRIQSVGTSGNTWANPSSVLWYGSCTNGSSSQCSTNNLWFNSTWTSFYSRQNSTTGKQYVNISLPASGCKLANGTTDCGSPYGFYWLD